MLERISNNDNANPLSNIGAKRVGITPPAFTIPECIIADTGVGAVTV